MLALREGQSSATLVSARVLVEAARVGDVDAFALLVRRHGASAYRVAFRMLGSDADAQDAVQDAFVAAWRSLGRFRGESSVSTWLYRIVTNRCLNVIAARRPTTAVDVELASPLRQPAELVESRERFAAVVAEVSALPADQRAALVLRDFEGLSYEEIGQVLGVSVAAVKGRIHRARLSVLRETGAWR
ncbi:MAG: RNA polymerase sigma factor [Solirubrobacteraceae bacterium]